MILDKEIPAMDMYSFVQIKIDSSESFDRFEQKRDSIDRFQRQRWQKSI